MDLRHVTVPKEMLTSISENRGYNEVIAGYYSRLIGESSVSQKKTLSNNLESLNDCNRLWFLDQYSKAKVKDFKKTNLCKDKFCSNCKKVKQASRMARFMPVIQEQLKVHPNAYQMVLTVPNVPGKELEKTIKKMSKAYSMMNQYLQGKRKAKDLPFDIGFVGAIRTLEITYKGDSYHPHFHVLLVLDKGLGEKKYTNTYSHDRYKRRETRYFSEMEIMIQKLWKMLYEGVRVTKANFDQLEIGYSSMIDQMNDGDYLELFKYMVKGETEDKKFMSYEQFKILIVALKSVRQIQGYGVFHSIQDDDSIDDMVDKLYDSMIEELQKQENPEAVWETVQDLRDDQEYTLISRKRIFNHLKNTMREDT